MGRAAKSRPSANGSPEGALVVPGPPTVIENRDQVFHELAALQADGYVEYSPFELSDEMRRRYIRATLWEDHSSRVKNRPEGAQQKFDALTESPLRFFRGTALLFFRDYAGMDAHLPTVLCVGDVHPENFGVMPNVDGAPFFGVNDFDEAHFAPFSWDLMRGAAGFWLAMQVCGKKKKKRRRAVRAFIDGYFDALTAFAANEREEWHQYRIDNSPDMVKELLECSLTSRRKFLEKKVDLKTGRFRPTDEVVPYSSHVSEFQKLMKTYVKANSIQETRIEHFEVKDVAVKKGSGTASLGLDRYWVLLDGATEDPSDDVILELKQTRPSALTGLTGERKRKGKDGASRVVQAHEIHLVGGDPYYGHVEYEGLEFMVRERSPLKNDVDVDDLSNSEWRTYAKLCGAVLAQSHARSDEGTGIQAGDAEKRILTSVRRSVFTADLLRFAKVAAQRVCKDFELYKKDHVLGAYQLVELGSA